MLAGVGAQQGRDVNAGHRLRRNDDVVRDKRRRGENKEKENPRGNAALVMRLRFIFREPSAGENRHRWKRSQQVKFLACRKAEENQDHQDPENAEEPSMAAAIGFRRRANAESAQREGAPRNGPEQQQRPEDEQGNPAAGEGWQQVHQVGSAQGVARRKVPRQIKNQKDQDGRDRIPPRKMAEVMRAEQIEESDQQRQHDARNSLRQHAERAAGSEAEGALQKALLLAERSPEEVEGERGPEAEKDVAQQKMPKQEDAVRGEQRQDRVE